MSPFKIREMRKGDVPRILEIERASFESPWPKSMFIEQLNLAEAAVNLVATSDGVIIGYVIVWLEYSNSHILNIAVDPLWRGKKAARALIEAVINRSRQENCDRVYLEVRKGNKKAISLYERYGFEIMGEMQHYYLDTGEDALVLCLDIR